MQNSSKQSASGTVLDYLPVTQEDYDSTITETLKILRSTNFISGKYMMAILEDDDQMQELRIALWKSSEAYKEGNGTKWITFATNRIRMTLYEAAYRRKRNKRIKEVEENRRLPERSSCSAPPKLNLDGISLSRDQWQLVRMRYMEGSSLKEIAEKKGWTVQEAGVNVRKILHEIKKQRKI